MDWGSDAERERAAWVHLCDLTAPLPAHELRGPWESEDCEDEQVAVFRRTLNRALRPPDFAEINREHHREKVRDREQRRRTEDPDYAENCRKRCRDHYHRVMSDDERREAYRARQRANQRKRLADPAKREAMRTYQRAYYRKKKAMQNITP